MIIVNRIRSLVEYEGVVEDPSTEGIIGRRFLIGVSHDGRIFWYIHTVYIGLYGGPCSRNQAIDILFTSYSIHSRSCSSILTTMILICT